MRLSKSELVLCLCAALLIGLTAIGVNLPQPSIGQFGIGYGRQLDQFVMLGCVEGLVYFAAVAFVLHSKTSTRMFWIIVGSSAVLRLVVVVFPPFLSNDMYRYIWDGWVQAAGINPYRYIPNDSHLAFLHDTVVFPNINRADYAHTIYPPAAEIVFFVVSRIGAFLAVPPVLMMKLAMVILEGIGIWAIIWLLDNAGLPRARVLIYAWNPVPVWEFAGSGHVDAIAIALIALALLASCTGKRGLSAAALAAATLTKFLPVILLPALWSRWDWKFAGVFIAVIAIFYAPYLSVGEGVFGFLSGYSAQEGINSGSGIFLLSALGRLLPLPTYASGLYLGVSALLIATISAVMVFGRPLPISPEAATKVIAQRSLVLGSILMVGLSPHYAWYYCWLLIPACIVPRPSVIYLVTATLLLYLNPIHSKLFWPAFVYAPFLVLAVLNAWPGKKAPEMMSTELVEGDPT